MEHLVLVPFGMYLPGSALLAGIPKYFNECALAVVEYRGMEFQVQDAFLSSGSGVAEMETVTTYDTISVAPFPHPVPKNSMSLLVQARRKTTSFGYTVIKRLFDLVVALTLITLVSPLLLLIAVMVRFTSPGPVFYREQRVGRFGKRFTIYKFRSMHTKDYLERVLGYNECETTRLRRRQHGKETGDPRITPVGRLLRRSSLDELPQLFNVVLGSMTLVGPRPVVAAELLSYREDAYFYRLATPGITGLWQVSGRSKLTFEQRVKLDAKYCAHWTFRRDLMILARTIPSVITGHGAY